MEAINEKNKNFRAKTMGQKHVPMMILILITQEISIVH